LRYLRTERQRIDSVVLMLPDTSAIENFKVTDENFKIIEQALRDQLAFKLSEIDAEQFKEMEEEKETCDNEENVIERGKTIGDGVIVGGGGGGVIEKEKTTTCSSSSSAVAAAAAVPPSSLLNENVVETCATAEEVLSILAKNI
jgi:hypothetical protein